MQQKTHTRAQDPAPPLSDAGPYAYGPPAVRDGQQLAPAPLTPRAASAWSWKDGGIFVLTSFGARTLAELSPLTKWQSYMVAYGVLMVMFYWREPRPRQSFLSWTLKIVGLWLNFYIAFFTVPPMLRAHIPAPLAFGLPAFVLLLIFHWVPPLTQTGKRVPLWQWVLVAAGFAASWGWWGPGLLR